MPIPNFFLIGAASSGTTSLYHYLRQHPDVFMSPVKEPCYFAPELRELSGVPHDTFVISWEAYRALFDGARGEAAIGEASVAYLASERAPALIAERIPQARILAVLRDPADRLFGRYGAARAAGIATDFRQWAEMEIAREASLGPAVGNVRMGFYATHLQRWFTRVSPARRLILLSDELWADSRDTIRKVFAFLGVDPLRPVDLRARHNVTRHVRWPRLRRLPAGAQRAIRRATPAAWRQWFQSAPAPRPTPAERAWAVALYAAEISALERLLDRDLTTWRRGADP